MRKMPECGIEAGSSDQCESETTWSEDGPPKKMSESANRAVKSANQRLHRSTRHKNLVVRYGYNNYMAHHYAYMAKVAEVRKPESYAEVAKDTNWRVAEEEMHALAKNETWDLVHAPKGVKPILWNTSV